MSIYLDNIKLIASELSNMAPKTQLEIMKLCKELCIDTKNYLVEMNLDENTINTINTRLTALETSLTNTINELSVAEGDIVANANAIQTINDTIDTIENALSNVYTKSEIDTLLLAKADKLTTYTRSEIDGALNLKADKSTTYTKTEVDNALAGKQATLVSGANIKTINNVSLLGDGNITISSGNQLYLHNINLNSSSNNITLQIITNNNTPFTHNLLCEWLYNHNFTYNNKHCYMCTGYDNQEYDGGFIRGIYADNPEDTYELDVETVSITNDTLVKSSCSLDSGITVIDDIISL